MLAGLLERTGKGDTLVVIRIDDRLQRGPEGWRHRLALIEGVELSWFVGDRITLDRLAL